MFLDHRISILKCSTVSRDTESRVMTAENSTFSQISYFKTFKQKTVILNCNISQYYGLYCILEQINLSTLLHYIHTFIPFISINSQMTNIKNLILFHDDCYIRSNHYFILILYFRFLSINGFHYCVFFLLIFLVNLFLSTVLGLTLFNII